MHGTSAGLILAGSFAVLTVSGGGLIQEIGVDTAADILTDTFPIRTLLIPSLVVLIGRWQPVAVVPGARRIRRRESRRRRRAGDVVGTIPIEAASDTDLLRTARS